MRYAVSAKATFSASHAVIDHRSCHRMHGHTWTITASVVHEEMEKGLPRGGETLGDLVAALAVELDLRDLGHMLPTIRTTCTGLAAWFFERLAYDLPGLERVTVENEIEGGWIAR